MTERGPAGRAALARTLSDIEALTARGLEALAACGPVEPLVVGWTGSPGAGKSSLIAAVVLARRRARPDRRIAVLAVDPTSAVTGGAVLGDRIRMDELSLDEGVFIRSLASRGLSGGLSPAVSRLARFLAHEGFAEIHVETVGAGQNDVAIAEIAETVVVVTTPHAGDGIQALKAGMLEVADIYCVNKCDLEGADRAAAALDLAVTPRRASWTPPVLTVSARALIRIEALSAAVDDQHRAFESSGERERFVRARRRREFETLAKERHVTNLVALKSFQRTREAVERGECDPSAAALEVLEEIG